MSDSTTPETKEILTLILGELKHINGRLTVLDTKLDHDTQASEAYRYTTERRLRVIEAAIHIG